MRIKKKLLITLFSFVFILLLVIKFQNEKSTIKLDLFNGDFSEIQWEEVSNQLTTALKENDTGILINLLEISLSDSKINTLHATLSGDDCKCTYYLQYNIESGKSVLTKKDYFTSHTKRITFQQLFPFLNQLKTVSFNQNLGHIHLGLTSGSIVYRSYNNNPVYLLRGDGIDKIGYNDELTVNGFSVYFLINNETYVISNLSDEISLKKN
ncbi:hypothetical protein SAMN04487970_101061 [Paenibacillus tianmuensis]|uniref:Uncharacterized protein n=1 Tax=Paenibacillus tianmuensis TaxID=624147 RepID=A0A1G4R1U9_9BACL|nr:hypothetical protein [Paenibacillus tianmuensis]SCW50189.1 hypothetical protein SAMN04487970_101061 [Paenibacillus tianmuensis]